jgi:hypothetical protein
VKTVYIIKATKYCLKREEKGGEEREGMDVL